MTNGNTRLMTKRRGLCLKIPKASQLKSNKLRIVLLFITLALCLPAFAADQGSEFYPAKVEDISDRAYEPAVIKLLDGAKESIVMSMYMIKPSESGPVYLLVKDLEKALDRGISVEIYLNTRPDFGMPASDIMIQPLQSLIKKGAKIYKFTPHVRLHDKLIVVDSRYVVTGSMNWSVAAIKSNYESADLIDSPELAKAKLIRLRNFPLEGHEKQEKERPDRPKALEPLPKGAIVDVSKELLNNKNYFAAMLKAQADRDMDVYLILLAESARTGEKEFFMPLEDLAVTLGASLGWTDTDMRRQMIKELKTLQDKYKLIDVNFSYGKDAWVELKDLPGGTFKMIGAFFDPKNLILKSQSARFGISEFSIRKGMRESYM